MIAPHYQVIWELVCCTATVGFILGHNLWLIAKNQSQSEGEPLRLEVHVGHHFPHGESAIKPERVAEFVALAPNGATPVEHLQIDGVALMAEAKTPDAQMAALVVLPRSITLEAASFANYIREEEADAAVAPAFQAGVTDAPQHEIYSKYAKAILPVAADQQVVCQPVGHAIEIVPERDPASLRGGGLLPVRVLFDGAPMAGLRVSASCDRAAQGSKYLAHARTDAEGRAVIELNGPGHWCLRSHYIRRHPDPQTARWESFWPSLTFHISE